MVEEEQVRGLAELWASERFAIAWTVSKHGEDAKRVTTKGWNETPILEQGVLAGQASHYIKTRNPALVARASGLILIDCDSVSDVSLFKSFDPPVTRSVYTRQGRHYIYRAPSDWDRRYAGIYFEAGGITPKKDCYLVTPPALHPSGTHYKWVNEEIPIAELPMPVYRKMVAAAGKLDEEEATRLEENPDAKIPKGRRHKELVAMLGAMRRRGSSYDICLAAALDLNASRFEESKPERDIRAVVDDAFSRFRPDPEVVSSNGFSLEGVVLLADVERRSIEFADRPILQWNGFHVLAGKGGSCKGTWTALFARQVTRGELEGQDGPKRVIFISSEDHTAIDIRPRCDAAEADPNMISVVKRPFNLSQQEDRHWLHGLINHFGNVGAVVIDPVSNHIGGADTNSESEVRDSLAFLNDFAADYGLIVIGVRHLRKDAQGGALASVLGSTAWIDLPRAVLALARDDVDDQRFHMQLVKGNRGPLRDSGRVYDLELVEFPDLKEPVTKVVWRPLELAKSVDELLGPKTKQGDAKRALLEALTMEDALAEDVKDQVVSAVGCSKESVRLAFKALEAEHKVGRRTDGFGDERKTYWFLVHPETHGAW